MTSTLGNVILMMSTKLGKMFGQELTEGIIMNREEILAMSREENGGKDLEALETNVTAFKIGSILGIIVNAILFISEILICGTYNLGLWAILLATNAGSYLYNGIKLKRKILIIAGVIWAVLTVMILFSTIQIFFATSTIL